MSIIMPQGCPLQGPHFLATTDGVLNTPVKFNVIHPNSYEHSKVSTCSIYLLKLLVFMLHFRLYALPCRIASWISWIGSHHKWCQLSLPHIKQKGFMRRNVHDFESTRINIDKPRIYKLIIKMPFKKWPTYCKPKVLAIGRVSVLSEYSVTSRANTMKGPSRERCYGAPNNFNDSSRCIFVDGCRLNIGTMEIAYIFFREMHL